MDDGQVIPGLNETWTFCGAKIMEWAAGFVATLLFIEFFLPKDNWGADMPLILIVLIGIPLILATCRKMYPDEERGLRNQVMSVLGFAPPGIPAPSILQKVWSGAPYQELKDVKPECNYLKLQLDKVFTNDSRFEEAEKY